MLIKTPKNKAYFAAVHDLFMTVLSVVISLFLRLGIDNFDQGYPYILQTIALFSTVSTAIFLYFKLYRRSWRYISIQDLIVIVKSVTLAILVFIPLMFWFNRLEGMPRSVIIINWFVLIFLLGGPRFLYRMIKEKSINIEYKTIHDYQKIPILLIGANDHSELFLRESVDNHNSLYKIVGIADDDPSKIGQFIRGVKVYGDTHSIPKIIAKLERKGTAPQKIIIAPDLLPGSEIDRIFKLSESLGINIARLPRLTDFKLNNIENIEMRPIALEDLLGRPQRSLDRKSIAKFIHKKKILITGSGGTIGGELTRQIANLSPNSICMLDNSEYNLYSIEMEINCDFPNVVAIPKIADIKDKKHLEHIFKGFKPDIVFHAAALKHVPMSENNISEAVLTNVIGTKNIADTCVEYNVNEMIMISTDKAVNPTNIMGTTKRFAESYVQSLGKSNKSHNTKFVTIRFGNVLGSTGSVIPLFKRQLKKGGPLTITDPKVKRYFMTVREAVELVLQSSVMIENDEIHDSKIFVLDMGEPVYIHDLAKQIIRLSGLKPNIDIKIEYIGLRPGEKLHEELFYGSESPIPTLKEGILLAQPPEHQFTHVNKLVKKIQSVTVNRNDAEIIQLLKEAVPEFEHNNNSG